MWVLLELRCALQVTILQSPQGNRDIRRTFVEHARREHARLKHTARNARLNAHPKQRLTLGLA